MIYIKPDIEITLFTIEDSIAAEILSASGGDDRGPFPGFETLSDAIDIILDD